MENMTQAPAAPSALKYLDQAISTLSALGLAPAKQTPTPIVALLNDVASLDPDKALAIGRTLQQVTVFNEVVRQQVGEMHIADSYPKITQLFDSIRDDAKSMVTHMNASGKETALDKIQDYWMKLSRGSIHSRFGKIKELYLKTSDQTANQLEREDKIIGAYLDFRGALKQAEIYAAQLFKEQTGKLEAAKADFNAKAQAADAATEQEDKAAKQLARDEAQRAYQQEDGRYQVLKSISENLTIAYNVGDTIIAKLNQTHGTKKAVYQQSILFFTTNESVFTSLDATLTSQAGLAAASNTLDAMKAGANKSIETLAEVSGQVQDKALEGAYGATIKAESVQKLVDAIVTYQQESTARIADLRKQATENAQEVATIVDAGQKRYAELVANASSAPALTA